VRRGFASAEGYVRVQDVWYFVASLVSLSLVAGWLIFVIVAA
jgi:hypothetical protein